MKRPRPLNHLSKAAKQIWNELVAEYGIADAGGLRILGAGLSAYDRAEQIRQKIDEQGLTIVDRFGIEKANPLLAAERDARAQWLQAIKQLCLDVLPESHVIGRPAGR